MNPVIVNSIVVAALSGLLSGVAVALLNFVLSKRRNEAEIQNLLAQSNKAAAERDKILAELKSISATVTYSLAGSRDEFLVDGKAGLDGFDVTPFEGQYWEGSKPISDKGRGQLKFEDGVLNIQRTNTAGKFELNFVRYRYKGAEHSSIPRDDLISGKRRLLASCEAKAVGAEHSLRFVIRDPKSGNRLAQSQVRVSANAWATYNAFLSADANLDSQFRIDDEEVSAAPSSIQIRNVTLTQKN